MEDLSRDMDKAVTPPAVQKPRKTAARWTLLIVGDHGRIVRIPKLKGLLAAGALMLIAAAGAAAGFGLLYYEKNSENLALEDALIASRRKVQALRHEKDVLLARVVVAESEPGAPKKKPAETPPENTAREKRLGPEQPKEKTAEPAADATGAGVKPKAPDAGAPGSEPDSPEVRQRSAPVSGGRGDQDPTLPPVAVDDFFALVESDTNTLHIRYKIRNVDPYSTPIAGRTFLVLKANEADPNTWMILPEVQLEAGRPVRIKNGKSFSISRFKTIRFKAAYQDGPAPFSAATILVYDTDEQLIWDVTYPIEKGPEG